MRELRTCRFCKKQDFLAKYKYGARHYAHWECYLGSNLFTQKDCKAFLESLRTHELGSMPVFVFADRYVTLDGNGVKAKEVVDLVHRIYMKKLKAEKRSSV